MSTVLGDLVARLSVNAQGWADAINVAKGQMSELEAKVKGSMREVHKDFATLESVGQKLVTGGAAMTAAITLPLVGIGTVAVKAFGDFEGALNKISALGDITGKDLDKLKAQAMDLGAKTQFSAKQAADGMAELAAQGFRTEQIFAAMPGVLNLAASGQLSIAEAAQTASDILHEFGMEVEKSAHVADVLAKAAADSSSSVKGIGDALSYAGPIAKVAGLSFEETTAAIQVLADAGLRGERAGTGLRGVIVGLENPTKRAKVVIAEMGLSINDAQGKMLPLAGIIDQLNAKNLSLVDAVKLVGKEAAPALINLAQKGGESLRTLTENLENSEGAAAKMAATLNKGIGGAFERMKGSVETASIAIGEALAPMVTRAAKLLEDLANKIASAAAWFEKLPSPVKDFAIAFTALAAAAGPVLLGLGSLATVVPPIIAGFKLIGVTLTLSAGAFFGWAVAIAAAAAALIALGVWINDHWASIKAVVTQGWEGVKEIWGAVWGAITGILSVAWNSIADTAGSVLTPIGNFLRAIWEPIKSAWNTAWSTIGSMLHNVWDAIKAKAAAVWEFVTKAIDGFIQIAQKIPGVAKLMNLDETWRSAEKVAESHKKAAVEISTTGNSMKKTGLDAGLLKINMEESEKASKKAAAAIRDAFSKLGIHDSSKELADMQKAFDLLKDKGLLTANQMRDAMESLRKKQVEVNNATRDVGKMLEESFALPQETLKNLTAQHVAWISEAQRARLAFIEYENLAKALIDVEAGINKLNPNVRVLAGNLIDSAVALQRVRDAFETLGIDSTRSLEQLADQSRKAYETIANDATTSTRDRQQAWVRMIEAQVAAGAKLPPAVLIQYEQMKKTVEQGVGGMQGFWQKFAKSVVQISEDFSRNLINNLFGALFDSSFNDQLDEQVRDLQKSLDEREGKWEEYQNDVATKLREITADHDEELRKQETDAARSLSRETQEYEAFVSGVGSKFSEIAEKAAASLREQTTAVRENLEEQAERYRENRSDILQSIGDVAERYRASLRESLRDLQENIEDRKLAYSRSVEDHEDHLKEMKVRYNRFVEDTLEKIAEVRAKNKGQYSEEEDELRKSLKRRAEDYQEDVRQAGVALSRKEEDFARYVADQEKKYQEDTAKQKAQYERQERDLHDSLAKKDAEMAKAVRDANDKIAEITAKNAESQRKQEEDLRESLMKRTAEFEQYKVDVAQKLEEARAAADEKQRKQTETVQAELEKQKKEFEAFKNEAIRKTEELESAHKNIFERIGGAVVDAFKSMGLAVLNEFIKPAEEAIAKFITTTIKDLLSGKGLGGIIDGIKGIGSAIGGVFGSGGGAAAGTVGSVAGTVASGGGAAGGIAGAAGGAVGVGTSAVVGMVAGVASAISSVIGNFQMRAMNQSLDLIEKATRYSEAYLLNLVGQGLVYLPWLESIGKGDGVLWTIRADTLRIHDVADRGDEMVAELRAIRQEIGGIGIIADNTKKTVDATDDVGEEVQRTGDDIQQAINELLAQTDIGDRLISADLLNLLEGVNKVEDNTSTMANSQRETIDVTNKGFGDLSKLTATEFAKLAATVDLAGVNLQGVVLSTGDKAVEATKMTAAEIGKLAETVNLTGVNLTGVILQSMNTLTDATKNRLDTTTYVNISAATLAQLMQFSGNIKALVNGIGAPYANSGGMNFTVGGKTFGQMYPGVDLANTTTGFVDNLIGFQNLALKEAEDMRAIFNYTGALRDWALNAEQRFNNNLTQLPIPTRPNVTINVDAKTIEAERIAQAVAEAIRKEGLLNP